MTIGMIREILDGGEVGGRRRIAVTDETLHVLRGASDRRGELRRQKSCCPVVSRIVTLHPWGHHTRERRCFVVLGDAGRVDRREVFDEVGVSSFTKDHVGARDLTVHLDDDLPRLGTEEPRGEANVERRRPHGSVGVFNDHNVDRAADRGDLGREELVELRLCRRGERGGGDHGALRQRGTRGTGELGLRGGEGTRSEPSLGHSRLCIDILGLY